MALREEAAREILKGTLVPLELPRRPDDASLGLVKLGVLRQLALRPGDVEAVQRALSRRALPRESRREGVEHSDGREPLPEGRDPLSRASIGLLREFEEPPLWSLTPDARRVAEFPVADLHTFVDALIRVRAGTLRRSQQGETPLAVLGELSERLHAAVVAAKALSANTAAQPIGVLNLERIEMVPAGIVRGELVATIPLAPGEKTAVVTTEWSVTSKEFTSIVTDTLEEVSETGVTDNTELSQSTSSQSQHSNQFNVTGTVQGGIPIISGSSTTGFTAQGSSSKSASESIRHARATTRKASARSLREHKVTISTKTVTGTSEVSTRALENVSTNPVRIDYFSLIRNWRVRLYRFGLRLTYDVVVPQPGAALRRAYAELANLQSQLGPFIFDVPHAHVDDTLVDANGVPAAAGMPRYMWLADRNGTSVPPYPQAPAPLTASTHVGTNGGWWFIDLEFEVPEGAEIVEVLLDTHIGKDGSGEGMNFDVKGSRFEAGWYGLGGPLVIFKHKVLDVSGRPFLEGHVGRQKVTFFVHHAEQAYVGLTVNLRRTQRALEQWRADVWTALYTGAQVRHLDRQEQIAARIREIEERLVNVDTLTLRREENDEIMKSVLRFVLGADFEFMPDDVLAAFTAAKVDLTHGIGFDGSKLDLDPQQWTLVRRHEDVVRFINQAIEWENVVTFLYSYFWDVPPSWPFIRNLRHPDPTRQAFLRAGSARVVLTVRKGWEERWMRFVEGGSIDASIPAPYLTIAQEIAAYDDRNYPGIAPANPTRSAVRLQEAVIATSASDMAASAGEVKLEVSDASRFVEGLPVVIDVHDERGLQEAPMLVRVDDPKHITVAGLTHAHNGSATPFPVVQPGERGTLIAEWNEHTPSSGTDIAVGSDLQTVA